MVPHAAQARIQMNRAKTRQELREASSMATRLLAAPRPSRPSLIDRDFAPVCFTFLAGVEFLALLTVGVAKWYQPDTTRLIQEATELLTPYVATFLAPEPA